LVDVSDASGRPDAVQDFEVITSELRSFGAALETKPTIVVASKMDIVSKDKLAKLRRYCKSEALELYPISAATGKGVEELKHAMAQHIQDVRQPAATANARRA
jgi:GTP-binding protein